MVDGGSVRILILILLLILVLILTKYYYKVLLRLTWLTVDPLEYWVKADPAEQVDLRNIRS